MLCKVDHTCLTYLVIQLQHSHNKSSLLKLPILKPNNLCTPHLTPTASLRIQVSVPSPYNRTIFHILFCKQLQDLHIRVPALRDRSRTS
jgi:hypothetical protein